MYFFISLSFFASRNPPRRWCYFLNPIQRYNKNFNLQNFLLYFSIFFKKVWSGPQFRVSSERNRPPLRAQTPCRYLRVGPIRTTTCVLPACTLSGKPLPGRGLCMRQHSLFAVLYSSPCSISNSLMVRKAKRQSRQVPRRKQAQDKQSQARSICRAYNA